MGQYLPVLVMMLLALVFGVVSIIVSKLLAPRRSTEAKRAPYESGIVPSRSVPQRFPVHFYLVAMIFIVFDIEIIFLFPWATVFRDMGGFGLVAIILFTVPVVIGLMYEIATGTFGWGNHQPAKRGPSEQVGGGYRPEIVGADRRVATTVRRVGLDGRPGAPASGELLETLEVSSP